MFSIPSQNFPVKLKVLGVKKGTSLVNHGEVKRKLGSAREYTTSKPMASAGAVWAGSARPGHHRLELVTQASSVSKSKMRRLYRTAAIFTLKMFLIHSKLNVKNGSKTNRKILFKEFCAFYTSLQEYGWHIWKFGTTGQAGKALKKREF